jgi:hypothetical protein
VSFNASAVKKNYNPESSLVRFENKNSSNLKKTIQPPTALALYIVVNSEVVGLSPDSTFYETLLWVDHFRPFSIHNDSCSTLRYDTP